MPGTAPLTFSMHAFNRATAGQAAAMMDRIVERSAWLAHRAADARPFHSPAELAAWLENEVRSLERDEALQLLSAHPELSPQDSDNVTRASQSEQGRLALLKPDAEVAAKLSDLNRRYTRRHGYPFIIALHEQEHLSAVIDQFERRVSADPEEELSRALGQVVSVMKARLERLTGEAGRLEPTIATSGKLGGVSS